MQKEKDTETLLRPYIGIIQLVGKLSSNPSLNKICYSSKHEPSVIHKHIYYIWKHKLHKPDYNVAK